MATIPLSISQSQPHPQNHLSRAQSLVSPISTLPNPSPSLTGGSLFSRRCPPPWPSRRSRWRVETEVPPTFLSESDGSSSSSASSVRSRFERMIREARDTVCKVIEEAEGVGKFKEDVWSRPGGSGGINRVLQDGGVWEKVGVNVSVVYGVMPPEAYKAAKAARSDEKHSPVPFFAAGISSVISLFLSFICQTFSICWLN